MGIASLKSTVASILNRNKRKPKKKGAKSFSEKRSAEEAVERSDLGLKPVLVHKIVGSVGKYMERLFAYREVQEVHVIPGDFDILAKIVVERDLISSDSEAIGQFVQNRIRRIQGVAKTQTIIPLSSKRKENRS